MWQQNPPGRGAQSLGRKPATERGGLTAGSGIFNQIKLICLSEFAVHIAAVLICKHRFPI